MSDEWQIAIEVGGNDVLLFDGQTTLGRSNKSDVVLAHSSVSRVHAAIRVEGNQVSIRDLGSTHGTMVAGVIIEEETSLQDGDQIQVGDRVGILRIRSLLNELESAPSHRQGGEPAVGSATNTLQKASLDLARKAQGQSDADEEELDRPLRPTVVPSTEANPAATMRVSPELLQAGLAADQYPAAEVPLLQPQNTESEKHDVHHPSLSVPVAEDGVSRASSTLTRILSRIRTWLSSRDR